jgi:hypothetical protein
LQITQRLGRLLFLGLLGAAVGISLTSTAMSQVSFAPPANYAATTPTSIAFGDFNGDTYPDVVTSCINADSLGVFFGIGNGTFQSRVGISSGFDPRDVAVADVNEDARPDLITVELTSHVVSVRLGNGDGTFGARMTYGQGSFSFPLLVAVADLNHDAHQDLVVAHATPHAISVFIGQGDGTFKPPTTYGTSAIPQHGLAIGDMNNDTHLDILAGIGARIILYLGRGDGTFYFGSYLASDSGAE